MKNLKRNLALIVSGVLLAALVIANSVSVFAAEAPVQPDPTACTECDTIQTDIDNAYTDLAILQGSADNFSVMASARKSLIVISFASQKTFTLFIKSFGIMVLIILVSVFSGVGFFFMFSLLMQASQNDSLRAFISGDLSLVKG